MRTTIPGRTLAVAVGAVLALGLMVPSAVAAPAPANDEISHARVISAVPSTLTVDTSSATFNATTDTGDYPCMGDQSVWFRFRPTTEVTARVVASGFDTLLGVYRGPQNSLTPVACNDDTSVGAAVEVHFHANTTYFIAVSTCCGPDSPYGGLATLRMYVPRAFTLSAPLTDVRAGDVSGRAFLTGTFRCTNPGYFALGVTISQRVGDHVARGSNSYWSECGRTRQTWSLTLDSETAVAFRAGKASVTIVRTADDGFDVLESTSTEILTVVLSPNARPAVTG